MSIMALLFPMLCYGIYYLVLHVFSNEFILFDILVGLVLGLYVVLMKQSKDRRSIALIHSLLVVLLLYLKKDDVFLWAYQLGGLSIALTRHDHIQPLCPLPKTRMIIMMGLALLGVGLIHLSSIIPFNGICFAYIINGLLMGFYLWMKERLNDRHRQLVTHLTTFFMLALAIFGFKNYQSFWIVWVIFSQIIQIFEVKFI